MIYEIETPISEIFEAISETFNLEINLGDFTALLDEVSADAELSC